MKLFLALLLTAVASGGATSNIPDLSGETSVAFNTTGADGLPWPLPDSKLFYTKMLHACPIAYCMDRTIATQRKLGPARLHTRSAPAGTLPWNALIPPAHRSPPLDSLSHSSAPLVRRAAPPALIAHRLHSARSSDCALPLTRSRNKSTTLRRSWSMACTARS